MGLIRPWMAISMGRILAKQQGILDLAAQYKETAVKLGETQPHSVASFGSAFD
nr:Hypothetical protein RNGR00255 [Sinorhizobium fredii NGR234]